MDFDRLVASVVPGGLVSAVSDVLVGIGFTNILSSQAWERSRLVVVVVGRLVVGLFKIYMRTPNGLTIDFLTFVSSRFLGIVILIRVSLNLIFFSD